MFHENLDDERTGLAYKLILKLAIIIFTIMVVVLNIYVIVTTLKTIK